MPNVFAYTDYRAFLKDWYHEKKAARPTFSYRVMAQLVGFKSAGLFTQIIQGKVNISLELALKFAAFAKLRKRETEYFQAMVLFCQAKTHDQKKTNFEKMASYRESTVHTIEADQYEFFGRWYHAVIRSVLEFLPFTDDYTTLAKVLVPAITTDEARQSIELLERLGMIRRDSRGCYRPVNHLLSTGYNARSVAIDNYILGTLKTAAGALDRFPKQQRNLSSLNLGMSRKGFEEAQQELREFRRRVMEIARRDTADTVYQFSFQLFPLSRTIKGRA